MMVKCIHCESKVDAIDTWRTNCYECHNEIAICKSCFKTYKNHYSVCDEQRSCASKDVKCKCGEYKMVSLK